MNYGTFQDKLKPDDIIVNGDIDGFSWHVDGRVHNPLCSEA